MTISNHQDTKTAGFRTPVSPDLDILGKQVVDCAFQVHKELGPGLTENIYEEAFVCELTDRNIPFEHQKHIAIQYKHHKLPSHYRLDLIVDDKIIVELKCVDRLAPVHEAQILAYLKLTNKKLGYLMNFNVPLIKDGIKRRAL